MDNKFFIEDSYSRMKDKWKEEVEYWDNSLRNIEFPEDLVMGNLYEVQRQLCKLFDKSTVFLNYYKNKYEQMKSRIKTVKRMNTEGRNPEERKTNARRAVTNFKVEIPGGNKTINLIKLKERWEQRYNFYNNVVMKRLNQKQNAVSNSIGMAKIEAQIQTSYGADTN